MRANDDAVAAFLGPKEIARHARSWDLGKQVEAAAHRDAPRWQFKPRTKVRELPASLVGLGDTGHRYFKVFSAGSRSHRSRVRALDVPRRALWRQCHRERC